VVVAVAGQTALPILEERQAVAAEQVVVLLLELLEQLTLVVVAVAELIHSTVRQVAQA
jgi:hypothetical protein